MLKIFFKYRVKFILFVIFTLIFIYLYNVVIIKPFPFFKVNYVTSLDNFNADPALNKKFYSINKYNKNISPRIENLLISHIDKNIFDKIKISTEITRELQETSVGSEVKNFSNIFAEEGKYLEICSESAKIFITLMAYFDIESRILWTNGHSVAEVWDGNNWIMTDTLSNIYSYHKESNKFVSFSEAVKLFPNISFKKITEKKYALYEYHNDKEKFHEILKNNELIFIMSNKNIYNFNTKNEKLLRVLSSLSLNNNYQAIQYLSSDKSKKVGNLGLNIYKRFF